MPGILQSRLRAILNAALVFIHRDRALAELVREVNAKVAVGRISTESALYDITNHISTRPHSTYHPAEQLIAEEIWRYNHTVRRNTSARERMRKYREANNSNYIPYGSPPVSQAPSPYNPPSEIDPDQLDIDSLAVDNLAITKATDEAEAKEAMAALKAKLDAEWTPKDEEIYQAMKRQQREDAGE